MYEEGAQWEGKGVRTEEGGCKIYLGYRQWYRKGVVDKDDTHSFLTFLFCWQFSDVSPLSQKKEKRICVLC